MSWSFTDTTPPELTCDFMPSCLFCGGHMRVREADLYRVQMTGVNDPEPKGRAIDVIVKCLECGYMECFGVALSQEEASKLHG